jgi:hypothetical protein
MSLPNTVVTTSHRVSVPPTVLFRELEGEAVVLNLETESYYGLDDVGTRVWRVLAERGTVGGALEALEAEYEVEPGRLRQDVLALVGRLADHGLVELSRD